MNKYVTLFFFMVSALCQIFAQNAVIEGYAYETDNRGYLNEVYITVYDQSRNEIFAQTTSNMEGYFTVDVLPGKQYMVIGKKDLFYEKEVSADLSLKNAGEKVFISLELEREPGYLFDMTIAPERADEDVTVDGIVGAKIEIYNNTIEEQILGIESHPSMNFQFTFKQGNHYTVLVRKEGYFTKRMEAFVDVEGCILCFEGIGDIRPAVTDNLTAGHEMGTLLANIEMKPVEIGEGIPLNNIYYDYNSAKIRSDAIEELETLIDILRDNPQLIVELGSHTDSRGKASYNLKLSQRRAEAVVNYLVTQGNIADNRIQAMGYGATQLVNMCKPGAECTEEQHQENRRTELKVVGFLDVDPLKTKSLKDIKEDEMIEALLREVQQSEVIEIQEGDDIPESLKKQLESSAGDTVEIEMQLADTLSQVYVEPAEAENQAEEMSSEAKQKLDQIFQEEQPSKTDTEEPEPLEEMPNEAIGGVLKIDDESNGYFIQIMHSSDQIQDVGSMWTKLGQLYQEERSVGGCSYLIGIYETQEDARQKLNQLKNAEFPDAFIVLFQNGQRIK